MRKIFKALAITVPMLAILPQTGMAARDFKDIYVECGLGSIIAPHNKYVAVSTNVTWDLGSTAISTNISCPENCKGGKAKIAAFIYDSQDILLNELASGSGDYLDALVELSGIDQSEKATFINRLRDNVKAELITDDLTSKTQYQKSEQFYNIVISTLDNLA